METSAQAFEASCPSVTSPHVASAIQSIEAFAKEHGFSVFVKDSKLYRRVLKCSKAGKYDSKGKKEGIDKSKQREGRTKKTDCKWSMECRQDKDSGTWETRMLCTHHNHPPVLDVSALPEYRVDALQPEEVVDILNMSKSGRTPKEILTYLRQQHASYLLTAKDISNIVQKERITELGGKRPIEWLVSVSDEVFQSM
jgi:hypothetical protein